MCAIAQKPSVSDGRLIHFGGEIRRLPGIQVGVEPCSRNIDFAVEPALCIFLEI